MPFLLCRFFDNYFSLFGFGCAAAGYYNPTVGSGVYYLCPAATLPGAAVCGKGADIAD